MSKGSRVDVYMRCEVYGIHEWLVWQHTERKFEAIAEIKVSDLALKGNYYLYLTEVVAAIPISQVTIITGLSTVLYSVSANCSTDCCKIGQNGTVEEGLKSAGTRTAIPIDVISIITALHPDSCQSISTYRRTLLSYCEEEPTGGAASSTKDITTGEASKTSKNSTGGAGI